MGITVTREEVLSHYKTEKKKIAQAGERFVWFQQFLAQQKDRELLDLLETVLQKARDYVNSVWLLERNLALSNYKYGGDDIVAFQQVVSSGDESRRFAHNALLSVLESFNRNASQKYGWVTAGGKITIGGIFTLSPDALRDPTADRFRSIIADWAFYLVIATE